MVAKIKTISAVMKACDTGFSKCYPAGLYWFSAGLRAVSSLVQLYTGEECIAVRSQARFLLQMSNGTCHSSQVIVDTQDKFTLVR